MATKRCSTRLASLITAAVLLAACGPATSDPVPPARGGGGRPPVTLRLGTPEARGRPSSIAIADYAERVAHASGGGLIVEPVWQAGGPDPVAWEQAVARLVQSGDLDMGLVAARAWDTLGVTTFQALQTPFLITTDEAVEAVIRDPLAEEMLAGLDALGLVGLGLWPEQLRHPFSFDDPIVSLADFQGRVFRVPLSDLSTRLIESLGATAVDLNGADFARAAEADEIDGAESEFAFTNDVLAGSTVTGNVTFFPKVNTLVISASRVASLSEEHRQALRTAAVGTLDVAVSQADDPDLAADFCAAGGRIVLAGTEQLDELRDATRPVAAALEADPTTAGFIERIRRLVGGMPADPVLPCDPEGVAPSASSGALPPDGVYRKTLTEEEMLAAGIDPMEARQDHGILTLTLDGGRFRLEWDTPGPCTGTYSMVGDRVSVAMDEQCTGSFSARWQMTPEGLVLSDPKPAIPTLFTYKPWTVVEGGGASPSAPAAIFSGTYRYDVPVEYLTDHGVSVEQAATEGGVHTVTVAPGTFVDRWQSPAGERSCSGTWSISGDVVIFRWLAGCVGDWTARLVVDGSGLRWADVRALSPHDSAEDQLINETFQGVPWVRID